jgi:hypothetical protein
MVLQFCNRTLPRYSCYLIGRLHAITRLQEDSIPRLSILKRRILCLVTFAFMATFWESFRSDGLWTFVVLSCYEKRKRNP